MEEKKIEYTLQWWRNIEKGNIRELTKKRLYSAPLFVDAARAFLSIQASSASAERLFSDSGNQEGSRRHHGDPAYAEMLLFIRTFTKSRLECGMGTQRGFTSFRADKFMELCREVARGIELLNN